MKKGRETKATLKMVAEKAGVSVSAVSMILSHYKNASFPESTKKRVLDACEALGYKPKPIRLRAGEPAKLIVIVIPSYKNAFYTNIVEAGTQRAKKHGYSVMTLCTGRDVSEENHILALCRAVNASGVLCLYQPEHISVLRGIHEEFPLVQLYDATADPELNVISMDGYKVGSLLAEHLYQLNHRRIAYVTKPYSERQSGRNRRLEGMRDYFRNQGLDGEQCVRSFDVETVLGTSAVSEEPGKQGGVSAGSLGSYDTGRLITEELLARQESVTAFVGSSDAIAHGIIDALLANNRKIPRDYSVCGCDNLPVSGYEAISLTTVDHYAPQKACNAIDVLIRAIESQADRDEPAKPINITRVEYEPRLIVRGSSGRCRNSGEK
ncbi:MAG: LacI family DNA-binding transcriptional regulator [Lachnospiraceae bacterium]|nr:LacI family DNA-binding transcriptional regulator [Lachnospiraceae bacterium]